ncbi:hypothetical protein [Ruminococcus sp.]|uniref:hypothetical protein n=1 Tax=Ruminococcus sp. TaxID=41978 RepID=UPI0025F34E64|nr:hypothetical protein [Ruminococcus sp.]MCI6616640.1 hypothetical protein [Ruminococcus sp.]
MKKTKRLFSLILAFAFLFSTFEIVKFSASTTDTRYSVKHLQNGNFEENVGNYKFSSNYSQPNKTIVPYWDTTAYEGKFEFFKSGSAHFEVTIKDTELQKDPNYANYKKVANGDVAAELNADEESTIYQRINTVAGSTYTWGLYHRGRDTTDRMVLIIGPEQPVDPSKPSKSGKDQFVRITHWLKNQYGVNYPKTGCSKKYTVYSKPFAASGKFVNENSDENKNISLIETDEINQEWSVWVISSPYCNTKGESTTESGINKIESVKGWSAYGTNSINNFDDIIKGASSSLGYDCTYTVPKGQTNTIFAFCSYSSGRLSGNTVTAAPTYGNLLDGINFDLYQPVSSSITPGGIAGAETIKITSDIITGKSMHSVIRDGELCTLYTKKYEETLTDCTFTGAYVTVNNADGTSVTTFRDIYEGDIRNLTEAEIEELAKTHFIKTSYTDVAGDTWNYYTRIAVESPVSVHLIYTKAPFVLYDSNGGKDYYFSPDNKDGGNLVGFGNSFQKVFHKNPDGEKIYVDTSEYYRDYTGGTEEEPEVEPGFYYSHAALPNEKWDKNSSKFCGWSVLDNSGNQIILNGEHTVTYDPTTGNGGIISFNDGENVIDDLLLDATHGVTLTALWKFVNRAQAQTYNSETGEYEDSAVGGYVEETLIPNALRGSDVNESYQTVDGESRIVSVDAAADAGEKIMFKATSDYKNDYVFKGWYCKNQKTGEYELRSVSSSIAVTVEEGKLNTYYARFQKKSNPVIFKYTSNGSVDGYKFYDITDDHKYGKYYQEVPLGATATQPTGDTKNVKIWFTSPTERGTEYVFDFSTPINKETMLYAGPTFAYNYFNFFKLKEPWYINTYGTVKVDGKYIDLINDKNVSDYNVYILKGTLDDSAPLPSAIKSNSKTIKVGKSINSDQLIYNNVTNSGKTFNRAGIKFNDFYLFNMKTHVWVVFDFTYNGVKYTSTVKDRCLYNNITTYMKEASNGLYTDYPPETQDELRAAQKTLLNSIQAIYDASPKNITEPTPYYAGATFDKSDYLPATEDNPYTFESTTAIRNIEPWGLKYSITVKNEENQIVTDFDDYGAVVFTDKDGVIDENSVSINDLLNNENSVMYSKSNNNIYGENGAIEVCYVNNMLALDFDKNTYAVFFVKDSNGKYYYSNVVSNCYNSIAEQDTSDNAAISRAILNYSRALINYTKLVK